MTHCRWCSLASLQGQELTVCNDRGTLSLLNFMTCKCSTLEPLKHYSKMRFYEDDTLSGINMCNAISFVFIYFFTHCYLLITVFCVLLRSENKHFEGLELCCARAVVLHRSSVAGQERHRSPPDAFSR